MEYSCSGVIKCTRRHVNIGIEGLSWLCMNALDPHNLCLSSSYIYFSITLFFKAKLCRKSPGPTGIPNLPRNVCTGVCVTAVSWTIVTNRLILAVTLIFLYRCKMLWVLTRSFSPLLGDLYFLQATLLYSCHLCVLYFFCMSGTMTRRCGDGTVGGIHDHWKVTDHKIMYHGKYRCRIMHCIHKTCYIITAQAAV